MSSSCHWLGSVTNILCRSPGKSFIQLRRFLPLLPKGLQVAALGAERHVALAVRARSAPLRRLYRHFNSTADPSASNSPRNFSKICRLWDVDCAWMDQMPSANGKEGSRANSHRKGSTPASQPTDAWPRADHSGQNSAIASGADSSRPDYQGSTRKRQLRPTTRRSTSGSTRPKPDVHRSQGARQLSIKAVVLRPLLSGWMIWPKLARFGALGGAVEHLGPIILHAHHADVEFIRSI